MNCNTAYQSISYCYTVLHPIGHCNTTLHPSSYCNNCAMLIASLTINYIAPVIAMLHALHCTRLPPNNILGKLNQSTDIQSLYRFPIN